MNDDPGAVPGETSLAGEPGVAAPGHAPDLPAGPGSWPDYGLPEPIGVGVEPKSVLFVAWRDLANRQAGGSEVLVDRLASGVLARGHRVTLMCGGTVAERPYRVVRNGGTYTQFIRAPLAYLRHFRSYDLIVEGFFTDQEHLLEFVTGKLGMLSGITNLETSIILKVVKFSYEWEIG